MKREAPDTVMVSDQQVNLVPFSMLDSRIISEELTAICHDTEPLLALRGLDGVLKSFGRGRASADSYVESRQNEQLKAGEDNLGGSYVIFDKAGSIAGEAQLTSGMDVMRRKLILPFRKSGKHFDAPTGYTGPFIRAWSTYEALRDETLSTAYRKLVKFAISSVNGQQSPWTIEPVNSMMEVHTIIGSSDTTLVKTGTDRYVISQSAGFIPKSHLYVSTTLDGEPENL